MNQIILSLSLFILAIAASQAEFAPLIFDSYDQMPEKKSHQGLDDFTSALNGAARLRYGKRAHFDPTFEWVQRFGHKKRAPAFEDLPQFVQNLNGAERLRFG
uniref:Uncharacterized protein n=1 Tax=Panagrolaimus sp. JU765 TaxID=591449 RepID=A0AC34QU43_9BILA